MTAKNPSHPSAILRDSMDYMGWGTYEFALKLKVSQEEVSSLMRGQCGISPVVALALERIGWSNAEFWMRLQAKYDLAQARQQMEADIIIGN